MRFSIRSLLIGLVIIIVLAFVFLRGDQLTEMLETMSQGWAIPLIIAVVTQLGKYFSQSFAYSFSFKAVGEHMKPRNCLPLVFGTFFMNTIAPSLNLAGTTLVVDDARRRGIPPGKATSAALLMQITVDSAFCTIMIIGFLILTFTVGLDPLWFLLGLIVVLIVCGMIAVMVLGYLRPKLILKVLMPIERLVNRIMVRFHRSPLNPWAEHTIASFGEAVGLIVQDIRKALRAYGCSLIASCCELSCFILVGVGFGVADVQALVCGYVVATLFAMVSITPQGVGVVEAFVVVAFTSFGVSSAAGLSIAIVYRGIVFWMPFIIGAILIQTTKTFRNKKDTKSDETKQLSENDSETATEAAVEAYVEASAEAHQVDPVQVNHNNAHVEARQADDGPAMPVKPNTRGTR